MIAKLIREGSLDSLLVMVSNDYTRNLFYYPDDESLQFKLVKNGFYDILKLMTCNYD